MLPHSLGNLVTAACLNSCPLLWSFTKLSAVLLGRTSAVNFTRSTKGKNKQLLSMGFLSFGKCGDIIFTNCAPMYFFHHFPRYISFIDIAFIFSCKTLSSCILYILSHSRRWAMYQTPNLQNWGNNIKKSTAFKLLKNMPV
ncbi:hypothetical protein FKM82_029848 [Ascaphus truei]